MQGRSELRGLAVIGCGAIAEGFYLPALARRRELAGRLVLVDPDRKRREHLGARCGARRLLGEHGEALGEVDAAIVAAPPHQHFAIVRDALEAGVHVLCEKPLAMGPAEGRALVELAAQRDLVLAVNHTRRLFPASREVRRALAEGRLGRLRTLRYDEGQPFDWPTASGFYFRSAAEPRGVLLDRGAHVLDLLCWWLGGRPRLLASRNDSFGGPEAVAHLELEHEGCRVEVRLSWLCRQANRFAIEGERGRLEGDIYEWRRLEETPGGGRPRRHRLASEAAVFNDFAHPLVENFLAAARGEAEPLVAAADVLDSLELIESCYARAERFELPWYDDLEKPLDG